MAEIKNILLGLKVPYNIAKKNLDSNSMSFKFEPLATGLGYTIGAALRRSALSYTVCPALVAIKVPGIDHEFSAVPNTNIDLPALVATLKDLAIEGTFNGLACAELICTEKKEIYVRDFSSKDKMLFIENDRFLFTTSGVEPVHITAWFACGYNNTLLNPEIKSAIESLDVSVIRISDYYFRPVISVSTNVKEIMYSGEKMDSLELIITTNGSVTCEHALYNAIYNITNVFQSILNLSPIKVKAQNISTKSSIRIEDENVGLDQSLIPFVKSIEVQEFLEKADILTVKKLLEKARNDIQYLVHQIPGGLKTLKNIALQIKNIDSTVDVSLIEDLLG